MINPHKTYFRGGPLLYCIVHNLGNMIRLDRTNTGTDIVCRPLVALLYLLRFQGGSSRIPNKSQSGVLTNFLVNTPHFRTFKELDSSFMFYLSLPAGNDGLGMSPLRPAKLQGRSLV